MDAVVDNTDAAGASDGLGDDAGGAPVDDGVLLVPILVSMLVVDADGAAVDDAAGASDAVDGAPPVDDGIMVPLVGGEGPTVPSQPLDRVKHTCPVSPGSKRRRRG